MSAPSGSPKLLLVGGASPMAQAVIARFSKYYSITSIDSRPLIKQSESAVHFLQIGYTKRRLADIFRQSQFDVMIHIGRIGSTSDQSREVRFEQNVYGTRNLLKLGLLHGIRKFVILGTHLVYGALRDNPLYLREDEPLRASETSPELFDAIELDFEIRAFLWRHRQAKTVLLRPVHILGPHVEHALAQLLRSRYCPKLIGFDPLLQFVHEDDVARAIEVAVSQDLFGVFNVAGEGVIPYSKAIELAHSTPISIPSFSAHLGIKCLSLMGNRLPYHAVDNIRYPIVISDKAFRKATGWTPVHSTLDCLQHLKITPPDASQEVTDPQIIT